MHARVWSLGVALLLTAGLGIGAAAEDVAGDIQMKGSDTMVNLCQAWAEAFMQRHPRVNIAVTGGGSGTGLAALIGGTCDLAASSRQIKPKELELARKRGADPQELIVALDGLAVVVHPSNPIKQLTLEQLEGLFTGRLTNWRQVGGPDARVVLLSREVNSGTHVYFKEHVLGRSTDGRQREFAPGALLLSSSQAIADEVNGNPAAIGYYGMGYLNPGNRALAVGQTAAGPFVMPSEAAVRSGAYPISRPLFCYTRGQASRAVQAFLAFVMSAEGQDLVRTVDFVPITSRAP